MPVSAQKNNNNNSGTFCAWEQIPSVTTDRILSDYKQNLFDITNYVDDGNSEVLCKKLLQERELLHRSDHVVTCDNLNRPAHLFCLQNYSKLKLPDDYHDLANKKRLKVIKDTSSSSSCTTTSTSQRHSSFDNSNSNNANKGMKLLPRRISATSIYDEKINESQLINKNLELFEEISLAEGETSNIANSVNSPPAAAAATVESTKTTIDTNNANFLKPHRSSTQLFLRSTSINTTNKKLSNENNCGDCELGKQSGEHVPHPPPLPHPQLQQPQMPSVSVLDAYKNLIRTVQLASAKAVTETISERNIDAYANNKTNIKLNPAAFIRRSAGDALKRSKSNVVLKMSRFDKYQKQQAAAAIEGIEFSKSMSIASKRQQKPNSASSASSKPFYIERKNSVCINPRIDSAFREFNDQTTDTSMSSSSCSDSQNQTIVDEPMAPPHEPIIRSTTSFVSNEMTKQQQQQQQQQLLIDSRIKTPKKPTSSKLTRTKYVIFSNSNNTSVSLTSNCKIHSVPVANAEETNITLINKPPHHLHHQQQQSIAVNAPPVTRSTSLYSVDVHTCKAVVSETRHLFDNIRVHGKRVSIKEQNKMPKITFEVSSSTGFSETMNSLQATEIMTKK